MKENLLRFNRNQKYILFDFETCSLNLGSSDNKPWQLSFLLSQGKKIIQKKDFYIRWKDLQLSEAARRITRFNDAKYNKLAVAPEGVLKEFESYIYNKDYKIVGHNILGFDVYIHGILRRLCHKRPDYSYIERCIDTNSIARAIKNQIKPDDPHFFVPWQYKLLHHRVRGVKTNLKQLCRDYDLDFDEKRLHDALYDIEVNFQVFQKQLWDIEI
tara:strand:- start:195 stop:836 length:642 start_codon:yes stop_codon:yes gene_type:complete